MRLSSDYRELEARPTARLYRWTAPCRLRQRWLTGALTGLIALSACAKKPVAVAPEPPPLVVPVVPPRLVGPVLVEEDPPQPVEEAPSAPAARTSPRSPRVRAGNGEGTPSKPEGGTAAEAAKPETTPDQATAPAAEQPAPLLRTPETADDQEAIRRVREILARAEQNLSKVNYRGLSLNAKGQHDTAKLFISQAEDALKTRSFTIARFYATKAETLSGSLLNR